MSVTFMREYFGKLPNEIQSKIMLSIPNWKPKFKLDDIVLDNIWTGNAYKNMNEQHYLWSLMERDKTRKYMICKIIPNTYSFAYYIKPVTDGNIIFHRTESMLCMYPY